MTRRWLSVVGIGEDGFEALTPRAKTLVENADTIVGGERHLGMLPENGSLKLTWTRPLSDVMHRIGENRDTPVCVLATGDPMFFGIGVTLGRYFQPDEMEIVPSISAFSLAAARLGWSLAEVEKLSLHGRPLTLIVPFLAPNQKLLILSDGANTPAQIARLLEERGYGASRLTVLEHMGGPREKVLSMAAAEWDEQDTVPFNTIGIKCVAGEDATILSRGSGLPDEVFTNDGNITKREVRAVTLSRLSPIPGQHLWDIGAGCGSVSIEWMRFHSLCKATAIEIRSDRIEMIARNAIYLGVPQLGMLEADAIDVIPDLDPPDAIFIGGGISKPGIFELCWDSLNSNGRLVANVVTLQGEATLAALHQKYGGYLTRMNVSRAQPVGSFTGWKPLMAVTQFSVVKN